MRAVTTGSSATSSSISWPRAGSPLASSAVPAAEAQSTRGTVTGTVTGPDGAPLPGVQVVDPALQRGTTTDVDGQYRIDGAMTIRDLNRQLFEWLSRTDGECIPLKPDHGKRFDHRYRGTY